MHHMHHGIGRMVQCPFWTSDLTWGPTPSPLDIRPGSLLPLPWTSDLGTYSLSPGHQTWGTYPPLLWTVRRACENMAFLQLHLRALLPLLGRSDAPAKTLPSRNFICGSYFRSLGYQTWGPTPILLSVDRQTRLWKHYLPTTSFAGGKESNWRYQ